MTEKNKVRRYIWVLKKELRSHRRVIDSLITDVRLYKRQINLFANGAFNKHRITVLQEGIDRLNKHLEKLHDSKREIQRALAASMKAYDTCESTDHERAQILNISHIAYEKFLEEHPKAGGSLFSSAFMHAETCTERESFIGERGTRDYPLFSSTQRSFLDLYDESKEFRGAMSQAFDETFGAIPRYQKVTYSDGTESFERMPPNLRVVDGEKEELSP